MPAVLKSDEKLIPEPLLGLPPGALQPYGPPEPPEPVKFAVPPDKIVCVSGEQVNAGGGVFTLIVQFVLAAPLVSVTVFAPTVL